MAETKKAKAAKAAKPGKANRRPAAKPKAAPAKARRSAAKPKAAPKKVRRETAKPKAGSRRAFTETSSGFDITKLIDHPLVADLLTVGAMAAVAAIADHNVKTRTGEAETGSSKAVKAAGKAAATAIGKRLMTEVDAVRKASKPTETKRGSR